MYDEFCSSSTYNLHADESGVVMGMISTEIVVTRVERRE
jgi:hypothetical protein